MKEFMESTIPAEVDKIFARRNYGWNEFNDEDYEILMVDWGKYCIYNALSNDAINLEDLIGFFA